MAARLTTYLVVAIVASTLIAGLIVGAQRDDSEGPVDLIVHNGVVYTADGSGRQAEAVAIRGNQILRVGTDREINRLRRPQTTVIDARGAAVLPGFNDASVRFIEGGLALDAVDLAGATTLEEVHGRITAWLPSHSDRSWVIARNWDAAAEMSFSPGVMDTVAGDRAVLLLGRDGRSAWANRKALTLAGIGRDAPALESGVARDPRTREATGMLKDGAVALVTRALPASTAADRARALRAAIAEAHRNGVTSVQHVGATLDDLRLYDEARRAGDLQVRVYSALRVTVPQRDDEFAALDGLASKFPDDPLLKMGAVAIDIDEPIVSGRAATLDAYPASDPAADALVEPDALNRAVRILDARDWQVVARASGDRAVRMALDAFQHAVRSNGSPDRPRRHRLDGPALVDARDLPRFASLGAVATIVPGDFAAAPWGALLGEEQTANLFPVSQLSSARARIAFGSGWPSGNFNPMSGVHASVNRSAAETTAEENPPAGLPLGKSLEAFTSAGAFASYDEQRKGTLKAGMLADLVVLSHDIFDVAAERLNAASVVVTIFDGKIVYRRDAKASN